MTKKRRSFTAEFKRDAANWVIEQGYTITEACRAIDIGETAPRRWISQLETELSGITPKAKAITQEQRQIQGLEKKIKRLELEKEILKAVVLELYAWGVVGYKVSEKADSTLVISALNMAWHQRGKPEGLLFHSEQGSQYSSQLFRQELANKLIEQSMSRGDNCWDNAPTERIFRSLKTE